MKRLVLFVCVLAMAATPASAAGSYGGSGSFQASPSSSDNYRVGLRHLKRERYAEAIPYLQAALAEKPRSADRLNYLGFAYRKIGENNLSLAYYQRALEIEPDHKGANEYLGELYLQTNDLEKARGQLAVLERLCPRGCDEREELETAIAAYQVPAPVTN